MGKDLEKLRIARAKGICACSRNEQDMGGFAAHILGSDTATAEQHMAIRAFQKATRQKEVKLIEALALAETVKEIDKVVWR